MRVDFATGCKPRRGTRRLYRELDRIGRIKLSQTFFLRDFLHSEIAVAHNITNLPDDLDLAVETGSRLCVEVLEPLQDHFGPIRIRSGYRSSALNAFGHANRLNCASNEKNYATHIWDRVDTQGNKGASACVIVPSLVTPDTQREQAIQKVQEWASVQPQIDHIRFFKQIATFNIGWKSLARSPQ